MTETTKTESAVSAGIGNVELKQEQAKAEKPKTAKKRVTKKTASKKKAEPKVHRIHVSVDGYTSINKDKSIFSGYTVALMILTGCINMTSTGLVTRGNKRIKAKPFLLRAALTGSAKTHWTKLEYLDNGGLTAKGIKRLQSRLNNPSDNYRTTWEVVKQIIPVIQKGGKATIKGLRGEAFLDCSGEPVGKSEPVTK